MTTKTIILSDPTGQNSGRGILSLYKEDDLLKCKLRLYNVNSLNKFCKIGVYHQNKVYNTNWLFQNGVYLSSLVGDFCMDSDFYVALVDTSLSNKVLLAGGTYAGYYFDDTSVITDNLNANPTEQTLTAEAVQEKEETCSNNCENCVYKQYFYQNNPTTQKTETKVEQQSGNEVETQMNKIFSTYPTDDLLTALLPNSNFAKINEGAESYSIGAIYVDGMLKYLCYATPAQHNTQPPEYLGTHYQWLPLDAEDPLSDGYYLVYQDAKTLEIINV
ncbi:MAG: hypothetical protein MJ149_01035 [Clostridia bacterium]|nr:hypothetical protein [Clostridia bacterium]